MTEIQQYQPRAEVATLADVQDAAIHRLAEWAHGAQAAHNVATTLVQTSFCPDQFRGKAGEATAAILAGMEVGLQPMAALRSFDIIGGAAAPKAITLRAVVQAAGHEMVLEESTATRCIMRGRRRGSSEWQRVTWTIDRARDLGVTGKDNWRKQPQAMLVARATGELARLIASDAILGIGYTSEEIADGGPADQSAAPEPAAEQPTTRRMSRRPAAPAPEPEVDATVAEPVIEDEPSGVTGQQLKMLGALMRAAGITERADALAYVGGVIHREVGSRNDLTVAEASLVIDSLRSAPDPDADYVAAVAAQDAQEPTS